MKLKKKIYFKIWLFILKSITQRIFLRFYNMCEENKRSMVQDVPYCYHYFEYD